MNNVSGLVLHKLISLNASKRYNNNGLRVSVIILIVNKKNRIVLKIILKELISYLLYILIKYM